MKKIYITLLSALLLCSSCNEEWLDTNPTGSISTQVLFQTTTGGYLAVNGLARIMTSQYLSQQGFNGEGTIKMYNGNYPGNYFAVDLSGWATIINSQYLGSSTTMYDYYPWYYYYKIIGDANAILDNIEAASGSERDKKEIKASALTYRAYAYFMLSQLYCKRWSDSNSGADQGLPLRLNSTTEDNFPFSTLKQVYDQVYGDLDNAILLFGESGNSRTKNFQTNADVAQAIYARAALTRQDYPKAAAMASAVKSKYPLMSNAEAIAGFYSPNNEWIWSSYGGSDQELYYYSYHAYIAYNSNASNVRSYPKCIAKELYSEIPETDIRRSWWWDGKGKTGQTTTAVGKEIRQAYPLLRSDAKTWNYMQFKIACEAGTTGVGWLNHLRSAEMYLIEAEALVRQNNGKDADAQKIMVALNKESGRDASYTCTKTGAALLDEIMKYRSIELWGEGFDWFDAKRTGATIQRSARTKGGSFLDVLAVTITPEKNNKWTWVIPDKETDYNTLLAEPAN